MTDKVRQISSDVLEVADGGAIIVRSGAKIAEEAGGAILGRVVLNAYHADIGAVSSAYVVSPFNGYVVGLAVVNQAANAGTKSVLTGNIAGSPITHPALEVAVSAAAGTAASVVPTAANYVKAGEVISIASDGGSSAVTPAIYSITLLRS
jgi:hypothetical protein